MDETVKHLRRAAHYRALALLFAPPDARAGDELRDLARDLGGAELAALAADVGAPLGALYHQCLGPTGAVRDCESDYEVNPLGGKGPLLADVAGFYIAFKYEDATLECLSPDHVAMELGFMGWLALRAGYAAREGSAGDLALCEDAAEKFMRDHLGRWAATLVARVAERCPDTWYAHAATYTQTQLEALEPGRVAPPVSERRRVALPTLDESDECGLPPDPQA